MQTTVEFLCEQFDKYNQWVFGGRLRRPNIVISNAKRQLGAFVATRPLPTIKVSNFYDRDGADYVNTLVHEMIHLYIYVNRLRDTGPHGTVFRRMMAEINEQTGLSMTVSTRSTELRPARPASRKYHVLFMVDSDGRHFISVVSPRYVRRLEQDIVRLGDKVRSHRWIVTNDPDFATYSCVRTLRGRIVKADEYERKLKELDGLLAKAQETQG